MPGCFSLFEKVTELERKILMLRRTQDAENFMDTVVIDQTQTVTTAQLTDTIPVEVDKQPKSSTPAPVVHNVVSDPPVIGSPSAIDNLCPAGESSQTHWLQHGARPKQKTQSDRGFGMNKSSAARMLTKTRRQAHITSVLKSLHWLLSCYYLTNSCRP